jgi:radical SAM superfamily enzyme YgiQ (UPF0313 family)
MERRPVVPSRKSVALVEFVLYENILPLVAGYIEAYARAEPGINAACTFEKLIYNVSSDVTKVTEALLSRRADVYAFSTYMWNSVVTMKVARAIAGALPDSWVVLGGPQVMNYGDKYLSSELPNMIICNGAGEEMFRDFLREVVLGGRDPVTLQGVSCYHDGAMVSTGQANDVDDVNTIPSPFLTGLFDKFRFSTSIFETNRGCPYTCSFCFFSKGDNRKLYKFDPDRVKAELRWLASRSLIYLFFADANFGIFDRDVELVDEICRLRAEFGRPWIVNFSAAKNKPERVSEISTRLHGAGVVVSQPVSFQSLNQETLTAIRRSNIKPEKYAALQDDLERKGIPSMIELIWPLPSETLESFKAGLDTFCRRRADTISVYPLVLLNNTSMSTDRDTFGAVTVLVPSDTSEPEVVVQTDRVSRAEYERGLRLIYAMYVVYNARSLARVARLLDAEMGIRHTDLFEAWVAFCKEQPDADFTRRVEEDIKSLDYYYSFKALGAMVYTLLHVNRDAFVDMLYRFATNQPWWSDERARMCFELDLLTLSYLYATTPMTAMDHLSRYCKTLRLVGVEDRSYIIDVPDSCRSILRELDDGEVDPRGTGSSLWVIDHKREQFPLAAGKSPEQRAEYCYGMIKRPNAIQPIRRRFRPEVPPPPAALPVRPAQPSTGTISST